MKMKKSGIDFASAQKEGAFDGNTEARAAMLLDIADYFGEVRNVAPDPNLTGKPTQELGAHGVGEGSPLDFAFRELFKDVDLTASTSEFHEVVDVTTGIVFDQLEDGQAAKVRRVRSGIATIKALIYGAGLGVTDRWLKYNHFYRIEDAMQAAVRKYSFTEAANHYALFAALGAAVNESFDTTVEKTIDGACATVLENVGDAFGLDDNTEFKVLANRRNVSLVEKSLAANFANPNNNNGQITSNVSKVVKTSNTNIPATHNFGAGAVPFAYVVLPGLKMESVVWQDLTSEEERNAAKAGTDIFWRGEHNCVIGDSQQVRRIPLA